MKARKSFIMIAVLLLVGSFFCYILLKSELNSELFFHYTYNQRTGEKHSFVESIFIYFLFWWVIGLIPSAIVFLFALLLHFLLMGNDGDSFFTIGLICFVSVYTAIFILMFLHITNFATINWTFLMAESSRTR